MDIFQIFMIVFFSILISGWVFSIIIEPLYVVVFNKPLYIYWYPIVRRLTPSQKYILQQEFIFYQKLSIKRKQFFEHRVAAFIAKYNFLGKGDFVITDQVRILISATFVMLTFGMRHYLINVFNRIIVYPESYFSTINQEYHKGEFNPRMKAVVLSWKDVLEGFEFENDNLNLGLHEFSHALYFHGLKGRDQSSIVFSDAYVEIKEYLFQPNILNNLVASNYFRIYAYTNQVEFMAVVLEHFFETPEIFKKEFPALFEKVRTMINYTDK